MKILDYTKKFNVEFNPMKKWSRKQLWWVVICMMLGSGVLGTITFYIQDIFVFSISWMMAFVSGQFYFIYNNWDDLSDRCS